jgi:hypothetical protein
VDSEVENLPLKIFFNSVWTNSFIVMILVKFFK